MSIRISRFLGILAFVFLALMVALAVRVGRGSSRPAASDPTAKAPPSAVGAHDESAPDVDVFLALLATNESSVSKALETIDASWHPGNTAMLVELLRLSRSPATAAGILAVLERRTGESHDDDLGDWYRWIWKQKYRPHPHYADFKAKLYSKIDPRFREYFADDRAATVRLDEIRWGGVVRDGIPPLKDPKMISAAEARYLDDSNIVFALELGGDARAYPKRILAWHEMVKDTIGGESLAGVYCTLCGSMIVYQTVVDGEHHELGTSGFLYRSNKLMYDHATKSLWSTLTGEPVVGPLVGKGIQLELRHIVTTTWGEWRRRHPNTKVLSLDTGHDRDYGEGVAYREYFATDRLMFEVPSLDHRLKNKAEVLALRFDAFPDEQLAISADFLTEHPVYQDRINGQEFVVLTDPSGANRVYETKGRRFQSWDGLDKVIDIDGRAWELTESELARPGGESLARLPAHRAFWFGWYSAYPQTRLVK